MWEVEADCMGSTFPHRELGAQSRSDSPLWLCQDNLEHVLF